MAQFPGMLKTYRKKGAPAWERKIVLLMAFMLGATVLLFMAWAVIMFAQPDDSDTCYEIRDGYEYKLDDCDDSNDSGGS